MISLDVLDMSAMAGVTFIRGDFRDEIVVKELERALAQVRSTVTARDASNGYGKVI